ncbi:unnamed protein product [Trifolium pratense]|uniref:Uncharacterized protein n=1 Tax=Trifolium pratense TaxID=57577 RepID=A0ACB0IXH4_TRIPR|nr:unnamed protein product [Trifolium pratense]
MLRSYYQHVSQYENSLVTKFYGVHCVKPIGGQKTRFIVMGNLFCTEYPIHRRFDLKGSSHGRATDKTEEEIDETTTLKDLDLNFVFRLQSNSYKDLIKKIERDCEFLEAEGIMDYRLLVGMHFRDDNTVDKMGLSPFLLRTVAPAVRVLVWICLPVAYPISKLLDYLLGHRHEALFRRAELKTLVDLHGNEDGKGGELTHDETTIIAGALELSEKTAGDAMSPINEIFSIDINSKFDRLRN